MEGKVMYTTKMAKVILLTLMVFMGASQAINSNCCPRIPECCLGSKGFPGFKGVVEHAKP